MKRAFRFFAVLLLVACTGSGMSPPSNLDDACVIKRERPSWYKALLKTYARWDVPPAVLMATIYQESKFIGDARTPLNYKMGVIPWGRQSSAFGFSQALDNTWDDYRRKSGRFGAKRESFEDAIDFMGWYMNESNERSGISKLDVRNQYLAYHEGNTGFARRSYRGKPWLMRIADEVQDRAVMYEAQLITCPDK